MLPNLNPQYKVKIDFIHGSKKGCLISQSLIYKKFPRISHTNIYK